MSIQEQAHTFQCEGESLLGMLAKPTSPRDCGVLLVVGGPQYRAGSHRQFLLLARRLAAAGYATWRFDYRGMGDSSGDSRTFESVSADIAAALDAFQVACPEVRRVVIWGLCDAASAALLYWQEQQDPRICGLSLLNPWVRSEATQARTQIKHYYRQRLLQAEFWRKLLRGGVQWQAAASSLWSALRRLRRPPLSAATSIALPFPVRMAQAWREFPGPVLLILSGRDYTAKEFLECAGSEPAWAGLLTQDKVRSHTLAEADHTFSTAAWRGEVETLTLNWLRTLTDPA